MGPMEGGGGGGGENSAAGASIDATLKVIRMGEMIKEQEASLVAAGEREAQLRSDLEVTERALESARSELQGARKDAADAAGEADEHAQDLEDLVEEIRREREEAEVEHASVVADLEKIRALVEEKLERAQADAASLRGALSTAKAKNMDLADTITELRSKAAVETNASSRVATAESQVAKLVEAVTRAEASVSAHKAEAAAAKERAQSAEKRLSEMEKTQSEASSSASSLAALTSELEGVKSEFAEYKARAAEALGETGVSTTTAMSERAAAVSRSAGVVDEGELEDLRSAVAGSEEKAVLLSEAREGLAQAEARIASLSDELDSVRSAAASESAASIIKLDAAKRDAANAAATAAARHAAELEAASGAADAEIAILQASVDDLTDRSDRLFIENEQLRSALASAQDSALSGESGVTSDAPPSSSYAKQIAELRTKLRTTSKALKAKQKTVDALRKELASSPSAEPSLDPGSSSSAGGMTGTQVAYLANVVLQYIKTHDDKGLLPVLGRLLGLGDEDLAAARAARSWW